MIPNDSNDWRKDRCGHNYPPLECPYEHCLLKQETARANRAEAAHKIAREIIELITNDFVRIHPDRPNQFIALPMSIESHQELLKIADGGEFTREAADAIGDEMLNPGLVDTWAALQLPEGVT